MKKFSELTLGILTAIGAFVDIGDIVGNAATGARFQMALAWAVVLGTIGIMLYAEMAGRIATLSKRGVLDLARERLGPRLGMVNLVASFLVTFLTLAAEIGGMALVLELLTNVNYIVWIPPCAFLVWFVVWRVRFQTMERMFGLMGLGLLVWIV